MVTVERRPNRVAILSVVAVLAVGAVVWAISASSHDAQPIAATVTASTTTTRSVPVASTAATTRSAPVVVTSPTTTTPSVIDLALPTPAGVVVFAHASNPGVLLRIDVDGGTVTSTSIGNALMSTGPVFLLAGPTAVVLRPLDNVPGLILTDSAAMNGPPGLLSGGTSMACSDGRRDRVWLARDTLVQVNFSGALTAQVTGVDASELDCDGAGEMLYRQGTTIFVTTDGSPMPITDGTMVATGASAFLVRDCAATATCALTVIDRPSGQRHALTIADIGTAPRSVALPPQNRIGSISPDGQTALLFRSDNEALFVDLKTGIGQGVSSIASAFQSIAWSADSRYAFYLRADHVLAVFDRETRNTKSLGVTNVVALVSRLA